MLLHEPATFATDCLMAAVSGWFAWRLARSPRAEHASRRWFSVALGLTAITSLAGGLYHGFAPNFSVGVANVGWLATMLVAGTLSAALAMSLVRECAAPSSVATWRTLVAAKLVAFTAAAWIHPKFVLVIIDYGLVLAAWGLAAAVARRPWTPWMLAALGLSIAAALAQINRWGINERFNHNDVYHVIQLVALAALYQAGRRLEGGAHAAGE